MAVKVAINGLGRIGRCVARIIASREDVELVAVNASGSEEMIQYNLKYDTVHGPKHDVKVKDGYLYIGKDKAKILSERDPAKLDFASYGVDVILECTGAFLTQESCQAYIDNGVKKVVMSDLLKMILLLLYLVQMKIHMQVKQLYQMHLVQLMD